MGIAKMNTNDTLLFILLVVLIFVVMGIVGHYDLSSIGEAAGPRY